MAQLITLSDELEDRLKMWAIPWETPLDTLKRVLDAAGPPPDINARPTARPRVEIDSTETYIASMTDAARTVYQKIYQRLPEIGNDVKVGVTPQYIKFTVNGSNFTELQKRKGGLQLYVHPEGHNLERGERSVEDGVNVRRAAPTTTWTLGVMVDVTPETNLDAVMGMIRKSYEVVRRRRGG